MLDLTSAAFALKKLWPTERIERIGYEDQPFLALVPKSDKFVGENFVQPVIYGNPQGRSSTFARAQANKGSSKGEKFTVTRRKDYSLISIDGETIEAAGDDAGAVVDALDTEVEGGMKSATRSLGLSLFRNGSGSIGQIGTVGTGGNGYTTSQILLKDPNDVVNYEIGQVLVVSLTDGGGAGVKAGSLTITAIDRDNGVLTFATTVLAGIAAALANDYIFVDGDYDAKVIGLDGWMPAAVTATAFYGVDRTKDTVRLAGCRVDGTASPIEEALLRGAVRVDREGGRLTHYFVHHAQWLNLEFALGSKVQYIDVESEIGIGFRALRIMGPKGPIAVLADVNCQANVAWGISMPTWKLRTLGKAPKFLMLDGNKMLRETASDSYEGRIGYYGALVNKAPAYNVRVALPTAGVL